MIGSIGIWISLLAFLLAGLVSTLVFSLSRATRAGVEQCLTGLNDQKHLNRMAEILRLEEQYLAAMALVRVMLSLTGTVMMIGGIISIRASETPGWLDVVLGVVISALCIWGMSVVVPLAIAEHAADRVVVSWSWLIRSIGIVLAPLGPSVRFVMEVVRRLSGEDRPTGVQALEAELMSVVEEGEREGRIDETERDMIEAVVEFRSTTVEQIMTPRTEMDALEYSDDLDAVRDYCRDAGHSRVPVYEENLDHIVGILYLKDLLRWFIENGSENDDAFNLREVLRPANFVPESKTVRELLGELLAAKVHIAIVADEYGGTSGLVTIEDIIEEIVGEIQDEYEPEDEGDSSVVIIDEQGRVAEIDARTEIDEANDELEEIGIELPESGEYDTVGGFVVVSLGRIPESGEQFEHGSLLIRVLEAEPTRVKRVRVELKGCQADEDVPEESEQAVK